MAKINIKTPISYYGGKQRMLRHILPLIPEHSVYTEAFAGGAAVFFAKSPTEVEVINDINGDLINFYHVLKTDFRALQKRCKATLHSRETFEFAQIVFSYPQFFNKVERAWAFWVLSKQGFASKINGSWGYDKTKNTMSKKLNNARLSFTEELSKRLENTQIECVNALRIIQTRDTLNTFHFVDPPYIDTDMGHYAGTFNLQNFKELLKLLSQLEGKFMLTMFPHEVLKEEIEKHKWRVVEIERTISAAKTARRRQIEQIVMNY